MRCEICQSDDITVRPCDMAGISHVCAKCEHLVLQILKGVLTLGVRYGGHLKGPRLPTQPPPAPAAESTTLPLVRENQYPTATHDLSGKLCPKCGFVTQPNGTCSLCPNCGWSGGCGGG